MSLIITEHFKQSVTDLRFIDDLALLILSERVKSFCLQEGMPRLSPGDYLLFKYLSGTPFAPAIVTSVEPVEGSSVCLGDGQVVIFELIPFPDFNC